MYRREVSVCVDGHQRTQATGLPAIGCCFLFLSAATRHTDAWQRARVQAGSSTQSSDCRDAGSSTSSCESAPQKKAKSREARPFAHATATLPPPTQDRFLPLRQRPGSACAHVTHLHQYVVTSARKASFGSHRDSFALIASARQQRPLLLHKDLPHTHKPRDFTTRDDVEKKHRAPEPRSSPTLKVRPQRATPSAPKAVLPRPLRTSGTSRECDLLLAQPFPLMLGTACNPWTSRNGLRWRAKACSSWLWLSRHFGQTRDARGP